MLIALLSYSLKAFSWTKIRPQAITHKAQPTKQQVTAVHKGLPLDKEFLAQIDRAGEMISESTVRPADEALVCECFCISVSDIKKICGHNGVVDLLVLGVELGLGTGCQGCIRRSEQWVDNIF